MLAMSMNTVEELYSVDKEKHIFWPIEIQSKQVSPHKR